MPMALDQLPDDLDVLKSLVADQFMKLDRVVVRNEQPVTVNQHYKTRFLILTEQLNIDQINR